MEAILYRTEDILHPDSYTLMKRFDHRVSFQDAIVSLELSLQNCSEISFCIGDRYFVVCVTQLLRESH